MLAKRLLAFSIGALLSSAAAGADYVYTPPILGVAAGGVLVDEIKDGFNGTEGPLGYSDGSLLFTETNANKIIRIAPDDTVSTFLDKSNGANGLALRRTAVSLRCRP